MSDKQRLEAVHLQLSEVDPVRHACILRNMVLEELREDYPKWLGVERDGRWSDFLRVVNGIEQIWFDGLINKKLSYYFFLKDASLPMWFRARLAALVFLPRFSVPETSPEKSLMPTWLVGNRDVFQPDMKIYATWFSGALDQKLKTFVVDMYCRLADLVQALDNTYGSYSEILFQLAPEADAFLEKISKDGQLADKLVQSYPLVIHGSDTSKNTDIFSHSSIEKIGESWKHMHNLCERLKDCVRNRVKFDTLSLTLEWYFGRILSDSSFPTMMHNGVLTKEDCCSLFEFACEFPKALQEFVSEGGANEAGMRGIFLQLSADEFKNVLERFLSLFILGNGNVSQEFLSQLRRSFGYVEGFSEWENRQKNRDKEEFRRKQITQKQEAAARIAKKMVKADKKRALSALLIAIRMEA